MIIGDNTMKKVLDTSSSWLRSNIPTIIDTDFVSYKDGLKAASQIAKAEQDPNADVLDEWINNLTGYITIPSLDNSSVGGNNAWNPYWSFNEDDDIPLPMDKERPDGLGGMGVAYKEVYQQFQQLLWVSFGVPKFNNVAAFSANAVDRNLTSLMNLADGRSILNKLTGLLSDAVVLLIETPYLPYIIAAKLYDHATTYGEVRQSAYFSFKYAMPLYYRMVNTLLSQIAVGMGLYSGSAGDGVSGESEKIKRKYIYNMPHILKSGPDIYEMKHRRIKALKGATKLKNGSDSLYKHMKDMKDPDSKGEVDGLFNYMTGVIKPVIAAVTNAYNEFVEVTDAEAQGASHFLGFRIEKGLGSSESLSNSVGESGYAANLNSQAASAMDKMFSNNVNAIRDMSENTDGGWWNWVTGTTAKVIHSAEAGFNYVIDKVGMGGQASLKLGGVFRDVPQTWKGSSFNKSYSIRLKLESRLGDPVSIFQSLYIPLAMWLVAAAPRQAGKKSYTSPFLIQGFVKGMVAFPMGMVTSLSIERGDSEFGWTIDRLPRSLNLSITISDLNPEMYVGLADSAFKDVLSHNDSMNTYVGTLTGLSLADWFYTTSRLRKSINTWELIQKNTTLSPSYWATKTGNMGVIRALRLFTKGMINTE